jgi:prepilin-type N-terminal cleavage/methylation domain-containing protein
MILRKLGLINKNQRGVTLLELLLVIAMTGVISGGITMTFFQTLTGTVRANNRVIAISQAQNAGYWVSNYAQLAQVVVVDHDDPTGFPLVLSWIDWDDTENEVTYTLEDMVGGEMVQLKQSYAVDDEDPVETVVAQFIDPDPANTHVIYVDTNGDDVEDTVILTMKVIVGSGEQEQVETRVYNITPRPGS